MVGVPSNTSAESAAKIMGRAFIKIEEVLELLPKAKNEIDPEDYQTVPFSPRLLYHLNEKGMNCVLFPAIPCYPDPGFENWPDKEKGVWTILKIQDFFEKYFPEVVFNKGVLSLIALNALKKNFAPAKWYLISARVMPKKTSLDIPPIGHLPYKLERSLVYIYAWLLFWRLRGISLFNGKIFPCSDYFGAGGGIETVLHFADLEILIGGNNHDIRPFIGKVPSIIPFEQK